MLRVGAGVDPATSSGVLTPALLAYRVPPPDTGPAVRAVILQPFYLPYTGVFELIRLADVFVHYDDVQYSKGGWINRNRVRTADDKTWLTVPVRASSGTMIDEARIDDTHDWASSHRATFEMGYSRAPHVNEVLDALTPLWQDPPQLLVDLNLVSLHRIVTMLGLAEGTTFVRSSDLGVPGSSTQRVVDICRELGADEYLSGPAARAYLDEEAFVDAGIELTYHDFEHPTWPQVHGGEFVPYLSVTDAIANIGAAATADVIAGCGRPVPTEDFSTP